MKKLESIHQSAAIMKSGGIILCPTDSIWGISCDACNPIAVEKIINLKGRSKEKSFIVLVNSYRMINQIFTKVPDVAWDLMDLAEKPLSLIMDDAGFVAPNVIAEDGSLGIRMIKSGVCFELISALNRPMVSTSANFSGEAAPSNFEEIKTEIKTQVDYCFPEVESDKKKANPSKIIKLKENGEISILRK